MNEEITIDMLRPFRRKYFKSNDFKSKIPFLFGRTVLSLCDDCDYGLNRYLFIDDNKNLGILIFRNTDISGRYEMDSAIIILNKLREQIVWLNKNSAYVFLRKTDFTDYDYTFNNVQTRVFVKSALSLLDNGVEDSNNHTGRLETVVLKVK